MLEDLGKKGKNYRWKRAYDHPKSGGNTKKMVNTNLSCIRQNIQHYLFPFQGQGSTMKSNFHQTNLEDLDLEDNDRAFIINNAH